MPDVLYIVVPCYKEEAVLPETAKRLKAKLTQLISDETISANSRVLFVNDGSTDKTWDIISELHAEDKLFSGVNLSRNRGHQNALLAGMYKASEFADVIISMDADLQDDINAVDKMLAEYKNGCDVVYGVRSTRKSDTRFKRMSAEAFYKLMRLMGVELVFNHADYRLLSRRAVLSLLEFKEANLFLRGIVPLVGYKSAVVEYERGERFAGESKYPLRKMLAFAFDGITSFSVRPIRFIFALGVIISLASVAAFIWALVAKLSGQTESGWASIICSIWLIGGIQMMSIGLVGEYIGKVYFEVKQRPRFIIESVLNDAD